MRVFLDTNVLVSAFAARGLCADVLRHVLAEHELIVGEIVLQEFTLVMRQKLRLPVSIIEDTESFLRQYELVPKPAAPSDIPVRDPDDTWVLASAIEGKAEVLVTGDQDLLVVAEDAPLLIVDPRGFWSLMRTNRPNDSPLELRRRGAEPPSGGSCVFGIESPHAASHDPRRPLLLARGGHADRRKPGEDG